VTVTRRGWRAITVDGHALRWRFKLPRCKVIGCSQDWAHISLVAASRHGAILTGAVPCWLGAVTPAHVAAVARAALATGWHPGEGSGELHQLLDVPASEAIPPRRGSPRRKPQRT
jgi:hypothetical protein